MKRRLLSIFGLIAFAASASAASFVIPGPIGRAASSAAPVDPSVTFFWSMASDVAEINARGPSNAFYYHGSARDTVIFRTAPASLKLDHTTNYSQVHFWNDSNDNYWSDCSDCPITVDYWFRYEGSSWPGSNATLFQISGLGLSYDNNDSIKGFWRSGSPGQMRGQVLWNNGGTSSPLVTVNFTPGIVTNIWYHMVVQQRTNASPYVRVIVSDGTTSITNTTTSPTGAMAAAALRLILIGNDINTTLPGPINIDDFRVRKGWIDNPLE